MFKNKRVPWVHGWFDDDDNYSEVSQQRKVISAILSQKKVQPQNSHAGYHCTRHFCFFSQYYSLKPSSLGPQSRSGDVRWHSGSLKTDQDCSRTSNSCCINTINTYSLSGWSRMFCTSCVVRAFVQKFNIFSSYRQKNDFICKCAALVLIQILSHDVPPTTTPDWCYCSNIFSSFIFHFSYLLQIYISPKYWLSISAASEWSVRVVQHHQDGPINESARDCSVCVCV